MIKYSTTIQLNDGRIITQENEHRNEECCKEYWKNYINYWGKVWRNWSCAELLKIEELKVN